MTSLSFHIFITSPELMPTSCGFGGWGGTREWYERRKIMGQLRVKLYYNEITRIVDIDDDKLGTIASMGWII